MDLGGPGRTELQRQLQEREPIPERDDPADHHRCPDGDEKRYWFKLADGQASLGMGEVGEPADATITQDYAHRGGPVEERAHRHGRRT
jgi:hypothetical protein